MPAPDFSNAPAVPNKKKKLLVWVLAVVVILLVAGIAGFFIWRANQYVFKQNYQQVYRLVNEKISQGAIISIHLPKAANKAAAEQAVKFTPEIAGKWVEVKGEKELAFRPNDPLTLNHYYEVSLALAGEGQISADFLAVENPQITAVFPKQNSEAPENSEITIIFNRPMVPLSTLGYLEDKSNNIPIEITPKTNGKFKWVSTNTLQFIPETSLIPSMNYEVKINPGFASLDGLDVSGTKVDFITRKLRYFDVTKDNIIYSQPISLYFNQPVNLEKIKNEITITNKNNGQVSNFIAEYRKKDGAADRYKESKPGALGFSDKIGSFFAKPLASFGIHFNALEKTSDGGVDKSIVDVYNKQDRFGRQKFWDFGISYNIKISSAYPEKGDIIIDSPYESNVSVYGPVASITAESSRTTYASQDFFDPQGKLWLNFYEDINVSRSQIRADKMKDIGYGDKCKDETVSIANFPDCEKTADKKRIFITFKSDEISAGEKLALFLDKITTADGLAVNKEAIKRDINVYPQFRVFSTVPTSGFHGAELSSFVFCTNTPILSPETGNFKNVITANLDYEVKGWFKSYRVETEKAKCRNGEFLTQISYGLMPNENYDLAFKLEDVFGQKNDFSISLKTGEMPNTAVNIYQLQRDYSVSTPSKTKLTYAEENADYVDVSICKLPAVGFLGYLNQRPDAWQGVGAVSGCEATINDKIVMPKKYWVKNYFQVDVGKYFPGANGNYVITLSNPKYTGQFWSNATKTNEYRQVYMRSYLSVTNLSAAEKKIQPRLANFYGDEQQLPDSEAGQLKNIYWVTNISDLSPVSGAAVKLYQTINNNLKLAGSAVTNGEGIAMAGIVGDLGGAIVESGSDSAVISSTTDNFSWTYEAAAARKLYMYTDKPIYRPGQDVDFKGLLRLGYDGNYQILNDKPVNVKAYNSKNDEIFSKDLNISEFGTFSGKFTLEAGAALGGYRVCAYEYSCAYFDVEEYAPAAFEVNVSSNKEEYISKEKADLDVAANYYFGVGLSGGKATYTVSAQNYYFDKFTDEYFRFGADWYFDSPYYFGDRFVTRGETTLDAGGKAKISEVLDLEKIFSNPDDRQSKIVVFDITVQNQEGQSVSAQKSVILHAGDFYIGLDSDKPFFGKNEKTDIKVKTVDTNGKPKGIGGIDLSIYRVNWIYNKRQEADGGYSYKWEKKRDFVKKFDFGTDGSGNYSQEISLGKEGEYEAEASAKDGKGNTVFSVYNLYVYGEGQVNVKPSNDTALELASDKQDLKVGEDGKIIIKSPFDKAKALIAIERGKVFDYQIKDITGNLAEFSFNVRSDYSPNVYVSVLLVSNKPEVKFGQIDFNIGTDRQNLNIAVNSDKSYYLPGEQVVLNIATTDYSGKPVSSEASVAVVDLSVLALKGNPKQNPLVFFYGGFPLTVSTSSNLKQILQEVEIQTKGGGGVSDEGLAVKKRGEFKETAFWQAQVKTGDNGRAQVKFTLPDNLTRWQAETIGITRDTKLGVNYLEFTTKKELMAVPLKPRFALPGDVFYVGAQIFNQSGNDQKVSVDFSGAGLELQNDKPQKNVSIKAGKSETVYFKTAIAENSKDTEARFVISAKANGLKDSVEQAMPINANTTYEATGTSGCSGSDRTDEYVYLPDSVIKDQGGLAVKMSGTLAVFISDALNYLLKYPYGCSEQIASKLKSIAVVKKGLSLPNLADKFSLPSVELNGKKYSVDEAVALGQSALRDNQNNDGGFSYWAGGISDYYLTLISIDALNALKSSGYLINEDSMNKAVQFTWQKFTTTENLYSNKDTVITTAYVITGLPQYQGGGFPGLADKVNSIASNSANLADNLSNNSLAELAVIYSRSGFTGSIKDNVFKAIENKINIDSRGASLSVDKFVNWANYETAIKNTALYLKAESLSKSDNPTIDKNIRWLLNSREKDGAWGSTNNTVSVIDAFIDFLSWKKETESNFSLNLLLNGNEQGSFDVNPQTILNQFQKNWQIPELKFGETNLVSMIKKNLNSAPNNFYYDMSLKYYLTADQIAPADEGFSIARNFYKVNDNENKNPVITGSVGEVLKEHIEITVPVSRNFVAIEDFIPAGMEAVNLDLATEQKSLLISEYKSDPEYYKEHYDRTFYPDFKEIKDDRVFLFKQTVDPGVYEFDYYVRPLIKGKFNYLPATVSEMYFPENFGRTDGKYFEIK